MDLADLGALVDAFYIGGTKNGALLGEALVICRDSLKEEFRFHMKQKGALLAKSSLLEIQFLVVHKGTMDFAEPVLVKGNYSYNIFLVVYLPILKVNRSLCSSYAKL